MVTSTCFPQSEFKASLTSSLSVSFPFVNFLRVCPLMKRLCFADSIISWRGSLPTTVPLSRLVLGGFRPEPVSSPGYFLSMSKGKIAPPRKNEQNTNANTT
ncbi:hypothetical protein ES703_87620 [subsurface metagenome]